MSLTKEQNARKREYDRQYQKKRRETHGEEIRVKLHEYYLKNKDKWQRYAERRKTEPDLIARRREYRKQVYARNPKKIIEKTIARHNRNRIALINLLGGARCAKCGFSDIRALTFDHINGGGRQERLKMKHSRAMVVYYVKHPDEAKQKLQVLCMNCNFIKKIEKREFCFIERRE